MVRLSINAIVFLVIVDAIFVIAEGEETSGEKGKTKGAALEIKKKNTGHRSTSSSSGAHPDDDGGGNDDSSLGITSSSEAKDAKEKVKGKAHQPVSSDERGGWKKWHRKCPRCLEDEKLKWRDPSIKWICGAYQRARRSFKSMCSMHYRNCQDGTMFVKIRDHRCPNDADTEQFPHGDHFFYEYNVKLEDDTTRSDDKSEEEENVEKSTSYSD